MNIEKPPVLDISYASRDDIIRDIDKILQVQRDADAAYYERFIKQAREEVAREIEAMLSFTVKIDGNKVIVDKHDWDNFWDYMSKYTGEK